MIEICFPAMGTRIEAWCSSREEERQLISLFSTVEATCSRFDPSSELSTINSGRDTEVHLSERLACLMQSADHARAITEGLVDVGVGSAVADWGYDRTFDEVTDVGVEPSPARRPKWAISGRTLTLRPDTRLDLGGIAKGWTCDRAVESGLGLVVSAGGDLRSAHEDTIVTVLGPNDVPAARVVVGRGALATSSLSRRRWLVADREVSHVIDPRTMRPVETPAVSATVVAGSALEAESGAKAVLLKGDEGLAWADEQPWIRLALVVWHDGSVYSTSDAELVA